LCCSKTLDPNMLPAGALSEFCVCARNVVRMNDGATERTREAVLAAIQHGRPPSLSESNGGLKFATIRRIGLITDDAFPQKTYKY
jgi:hypothetical protein